MRHSLELYFLFNFIVDAALFSVIARANGCFRFGRVIRASSLSAVYALLADARPALVHPLFQAILLVPVSLLLTSDPEPFRWCSVCLQLFCCAALTGGVGLLLPDGRPYAAVAVGILCASLLFSIRRQRLTTWEVTVLLTLRGRGISFQALIDTGNRLHEPLSGLPVLIVEDSLLAELLPEGENLPCRRIAFGGLGGNGTVRCFRPDDVLIRRGSRLLQAPSVWVAIYPGRIPGSTRALAPPSFAVIRGNA